MRPMGLVVIHLHYLGSFLGGPKWRVFIHQKYIEHLGILKQGTSKCFIFKIVGFSWEVFGIGREGEVKKLREEKNIVP